MNIHERIQQLRKMHNLSQEQLADRLGVSRQAVSKWESRQSLPDIDKIIAISNYFSVSCDWLLKGEETGRIPYTTERKSTKTIDKQRLTLTATCMNAVGVVVGVALWREWQTLPALAIGFVLVLAAFFIMGMGATFMEKPDRDISVFQWVKKIIWLDAAFPIRLIGRRLLGYTQYYISLPAGIATIVIMYLVICLGTVYFADRKIKKSQQN